MFAPDENHVSEPAGVIPPPYFYDLEDDEEEDPCERQRRGRYAGDGQRRGRYTSIGSN